MSGLKLGGSLSVTKSALRDVGDLLDTSVQFELVTHDRDTVYSNESYAFYIQIDYDMNSLITYTPSNTENSLDDAYAFAGLNRSNLNADNIVLSLPTRDNLTIEAGLIDALDLNNESRGTFPVTLTLSVNNQGVLASSIAISGSDALANVVDSNLLAQVAYWPINSAVAPSVNADTADNLSQPVSASEMSTHFASQLETINKYYNGVNLIESWVLTLDAIPSSTSNQLSNFARSSGNPGSSAVFVDGNKVVAQNQFDYEIRVNDYAGVERVVVPTEKVFGVVQHKS